jgi:hypothetical protein
MVQKKKAKVTPIKSNFDKMLDALDMMSESSMVTLESPS